MLDMLDRMYIMMMCAAHRFKEEEKGAVDLVTIVVLIGVAVALAVIFRTKAGELIRHLFDDLISPAAEKAINESK